MPLLEVRHLSKSFGAVQALKDVSLSIGAGEVVADDGRFDCFPVVVAEGHSQTRSTQRAMRSPTTLFIVPILKCGSVMPMNASASVR